MRVICRCTSVDEQETGHAGHEGFKRAVVLHAELKNVSVRLVTDQRSEYRQFRVGGRYEVDLPDCAPDRRMGLRVGPVSNQQGDAPVALLPRSENIMVMTDTQQVTCQIDPRNAKGNPAPLDGVPQWATGNPGVATVTPSENGLTCLVKAVAAGSTQISVIADADMDEGEVRELIGTLDIEVRPGEAVTLGITAGVPEEQPAA